MTGAQHINNLSKDRPPHETCFEVFGFDIMVDADMKPYLLI